MPVSYLKRLSRSLKDRIFPWRKRRRAFMANVGRQIGQLYEHLAETRQNAERNSQSIWQLSQDDLAQREGLEKMELRIHLSDSQNFVRHEHWSQQVAELEQKQEIANQQLNQFSEMRERLERLMQSWEQNVISLSGNIEVLEKKYSTLSELMRQQHRTLRKSVEEQCEKQVDLQQNYQVLLQQLLENHQGLERQQESVRALKSEFDSQISAPDPKTHELANSSQLLHPAEGAPGSLSLRYCSILHSLAHRVAQLEMKSTLKNTPFAAVREKTAVSESSGGNANSTPGASSNDPLCAMAAPRPSRFSSSSYDYYSQEIASKSTPFIYLDVKSVPRSGLHYLKHTLETILGSRFSFCEWYQEPGCCRQMPCALTCYAKSSAEQRWSHVRMIKSHDFDLADPIFPNNQVLRRVVLIRDPIYSLTSYWSLNVLEHNQALLEKAGIRTLKISYLHERPILESAFSIIDAAGTFPDAEKLEGWLQSAKRYMLGFIEKWGRHVPSDSIVRYDKLDGFIRQLLCDVLPRLALETQSRVETWLNKPKHAFIPRSTPFGSSSKRIAEHLQQNAELFRRCAEEIIREDSTSLFASCEIRSPVNSIAPNSTLPLDLQNGRDAA
jgi:hypothetical protein